LDKDAIYKLENINHVYTFLHHSVDIGEATKTRCINIITIISLVIYWKYDLASSGHTIDEFKGFEKLLSSLSVDQSLPDVIREYVLSTQSNLNKDSLYRDALSKLYGFKKIMRKGWIDRKIDRHKNIRVESDAEHTWACCMLANILLPTNIYDCELIKGGAKDFDSYSKYDKQKVLGLLLVHDLPECITGDIAAPDKTKKDKENETIAIGSIRALGAFPGLSALYDIADQCNEFNLRDKRDADINVLIASDIDVLEPLLQLYFYRKYLMKPYNYEEVREWVTKETFRIHTSFGNGLFNLMKKYFLNEECFKHIIEE